MRHMTNNDRELSSWEISLMKEEQSATVNRYSQNNNPPGLIYRGIFTPQS